MVDVGREFRSVELRQLASSRRVGSIVLIASKERNGYCSV